MKFTGIIPPAITPFDADGQIDRNGYAQVLEYMIDHGVHAIIVGGTTGEYYAMSREERVEQFRFAQSVINGRVPLVCGVNDITTEACCELARAARDAKADGLLIAAPYYSLPSEVELAQHCLDVDQATGLPIMLYNYPGRTGVNMGEEFLDIVGQNSNFASIKEASGDINRVHLIVNQYPQMDLSCGAEDQALEFFVWGANSWVTPMGNFFADEVVAFYNTCVVEKDFDKARQLMQAFMPLTQVLEGGGKFLQSVKFSCAFQGLPAGPVRRPMRPLDDALAEQLRAVLSSAKTRIHEILTATDVATPVRLVEHG